ncbi:thioredoxin domain-containing protein [Candidatus Woesearchaeota archaeon]|nr:thioredoxin domain-containing protein [Candidatus Woesearchaeota archaeon]
MINFQRNNLDNALSPYLQQHKNNPVFWQEWSKEALEFAKQHQKLLFISIGYSACHWCHVMAEEAFSNQPIAHFLNEHFLSLKVDREQRPDIDHYFMSFIQAAQGQGGWPLNVFCTMDLMPLVAMTYVPAEEKYGLAGFLEVLKEVKEGYEKHKTPVKAFTPSPPSLIQLPEDHVIQLILNHFNAATAAFGPGAQFPPHCTLLFLLHYDEQTKSLKVRQLLGKLLDVIAARGLHDHLQGGFFRYCVDENWNIPHFEKMLYDQAMLLWVYSLGYKVLKRPAYKIIAEKIIRCLEDSFAGEGMYYAGIDADTGHQEGETYLWTKEELQQALPPEEFEKFSGLYSIEENFEGKIHLIKQGLTFLPEIEEKLLKIRKKRKHPSVDRKYITSWNALTGISLLLAGRYLKNTSAREKALSLFNALAQQQVKNGQVVHSSLAGKLQAGAFLEDYASLLLFATYVYEETGKHQELMVSSSKELKNFKKTFWIESITEDFIPIPAQNFDHPLPSSTALAELAQWRFAAVLKNKAGKQFYYSPLQHDGLNLLAVLSRHTHIVQTPHLISWDALPINCIQLPGKELQDFYHGKYLAYSHVAELVQSLQ